MEEEGPPDVRCGVCDVRCAMCDVGVPAGPWVPLPRIACSLAMAMGNVQNSLNLDPRSGVRGGVRNKRDKSDK
jgi:hypothetical protein